MTGFYHFLLTSLVVQWPLAIGAIKVCKKRLYTAPVTNRRQRFVILFLKSDKMSDLKIGF